MTTYTKKKVKNYRKKSYAPKLTTMNAIGHLAEKAWQGVKAVKKLINVEHNDISYAGTWANTDTQAGTMYSLTNMAQGTDVGQRIGLTIRPQHYEFKVSALIPDAGQSSQVMRLVIVQDRQNNGAVPAYTDVLQTTGPGAVVSMYNRTNLDRFKILEDKTFNFSITGSRIIHHTLSIPLETHIYYLDAGGTPSSNRENNIYAFMITSATVTADAGFASFESRLTFTDN